MATKAAVTKAKDLMTPNPVMISPSATLQQAAKKMEAVQCGALPVGSENKLKGIITDRDIVLRAIAKGKDAAHEKVSDYMTAGVFTCNENDSLEDASEIMHAHRVSRLVVKDGEGKISGIISFGSILRNEASAIEIANIVKHAVCPVCV
jgi:CBS domain-containing protein